MKKGLLIGIITLCITFMATFVVAFSPKKNLRPSDYNIGVTYETAIKDTKPMIALFYTDWCSYCIKVMPKYKMIADIYKDKYNFVMINLEDSSKAAVIKDFSVNGMPTIYIIDPILDNRVSINTSLYDDLKKMRAEFDRYLRIRAMIPQNYFK